VVAGLFLFFGYGIAAIACLLAALWIMRQGSRERADRNAALVALGITATWCLMMASLGPSHLAVQFAMVAVNLAWLFMVLRLFGNDGRDDNVRLVRPVLAVLATVETCQFVLLYLQLRGQFSAELSTLILNTSALLGVLVAVGALVLVHNLYGGAASTTRRLLNWTIAALALFWGWELNHHFVTYLTGQNLAQLDTLRALVTIAFAISLAIGFGRNSAGLKFMPSRAVAFQSLSLVLIALYLGAIAFVSEVAGRFSGDLGRLIQVGFLLAGAAMALIWLPSERLRRGVKVRALKHLFKHRYDYRNEWIRFTHTIGRPDDGDASLHDRAIKSLADIAGCEAGLLLLRDEDGEFVLGSRWRWRDATVPAEALPLKLIQILEKEQLIVDFDEVRREISYFGELELLPEWLRGDDRLWAAVPLLHHARLIGVIILAKPQVPRPLDWEDFDLLSVAGQQIASYLAEQAGQVALNQASQFDEFNRRMAFVMHDIKNLSSQMSLLLRNSEKHADNPEFRKDMLVTVRNSADKLNSMLARLGRYENRPTTEPEQIDLVMITEELRRRFEHSHPVVRLDNGPCTVLGDKDALEQALSHIIQNAIDASDAAETVELVVRNDGVRGTVSVIDTGAGMSAAFVRNELFRPFSSSKEGGFGIGAYEARSMVRAMGGRLSVESREGLGSRFEVSLPLKASKDLMEQHGVGKTATVGASVPEENTEPEPAAKASNFSENEAV
jgi:putative PEP-CTERM system histidine kinase